MRLFFTIAFLIYYELIFAQNKAILLPETSSVIITGTSTLHDWKENVEKFDVTLELAFRDAKIAGVQKAEFWCRSSSITSDNSLMTSKTHHALQTDKFPEIRFSMVSVEKFSAQQEKFSGTLIGDLEVAGVIKRIRLDFIGQNAGNVLFIMGSKQINMTDFKIKPPTAMMGTLKTGEIVVVSFNLRFRVS